MLHHYRKHHLSINILIIIVLATLIASYLNYNYTRDKLRLSYDRTFEKKSLTELDAAHTTYTTVYRNFFHQSLSAIGAFASSSSLLANLSTGRDLQPLLDQQRQSNPIYDAMSILDKNGVLLTVSGGQPSSERAIGSNFAYREYFQKAVTTRQAYASNSFTSSLLNKNTIAFSAPILDPTGQLLGVAVGFNYISQLDSHWILPPISPEFSYVVTDLAGNILLENNQSPNEKVTIGRSDGAIGKLMLGADTITDQEITYRNEQSLVKGSRLTLGPSNAYLLVTSFPVKISAQEYTSFQQEFRIMYAELMLRDGALLLISYALIIWLVRRNQHVH